MTTCTRCGHRIEVGRFCTNCGAPVGSVGPGPTDTAERPVTERAAGPAEAPPAPPPPLPPAPTTARFPLFADEVDAAGGPVSSYPSGPPPASPPAGAAPAPPTAPPAPRPAHRRRTGWLVWVVIAAVLVVVALAGASLLLADGGDDDRADDPAGAASSTPPAEETTAPTDPGSEEPPPSEEAPAGDPEDVAGAATAEVPATAPPGTDVDGARIRYDAGKMLDGDPQTCWRMTGDGTGSEIVLTLAEPTTVTALGLINGYAKTARDGRGRPLNWYAGNRRILAVEWVLDDGTVVPQDLEESRELQAVEIDPVETTKVVLRLVEVSSPGTGRAKRDNTAVSEVAVVGTPAG